MTLDVQLLPELPNGFSGSVKEDRLYIPSGVEGIFSGYFQQKPMIVDVDGCPLGAVSKVYTFMNAARLTLTDF